MKGLVLGAYVESDKGFKLTPGAKKFDDTVSGGLTEYLNVSGIKQGKARIFYKLGDEFGAVVVVGLGKESAGFNEDEDWDEARENVRTASAVGCRALQELEVDEVSVEEMGDAEAAAEGATLGTFIFQDYKEPSSRKKIPCLSLYSSSDKGWECGLVKAQAQNLARTLIDTPANKMTPTIFCQTVEKELVNQKSVTVKIHDRAWAEGLGMGSFLSVTNGSDQPPKFLELSYMAGPSSAKPIVLIGKGVTFDSGGISLKPPSKMDAMRGDMGGAASVVSTIKALAILKVPVNVIGLTPLCENLPSGRATKPGDVVTAMNGKNIIVENTDAEGRLILADANCYAATFNPCLVVNMATLTGAMGVALGSTVSGVFSTAEENFKKLQKAGSHTGDRVWRFPLYKDYSKKMTDYPSVDLNNMGKGAVGGACKAAAFLREFAPSGVPWMHLDIAGVMGPDTDVPYLRQGMTGRPVRTIIQFVSDLAYSS